MPSMSAPAQDGLRTTVKRILFGDVFNSVNAKWKRWSVMIVDESSLRIVSNVIGMYDLMENRITIVDSLEKKRAPYQDMAAVYFVAPTEDSIDRIINDWKDAPIKKNDGNNQKVKKQLYANAVFLYFLYRIPDELLNKIKKCPPLLARIRALSEVNMNFLAIEERAYHFDMKPTNVIRNLYGERGTSDIQDRIASKLVTVCATLNEYPHVRYQEDSPLGNALAMAFHDKMNAFIGASPSWWYHGDASHTTRDRSTLLILDRQLDVLSPFMHEFTYQAMVNDLLKIKDDKITYTQSPEEGSNDVPTEKEVLLNDNDQLWVELRSKHIADVIQTLSTRISDVVNSNSGSIHTKTQKNLTIHQMTDALKSLPEYREVMSKLSQHMHIAHKCMELFQAQNLLELSDLEQTLATGQDDEGRHPKVSELITSVKDTLPTLSKIARIRLLAILIVSQTNNLKQTDVDSLIQLSDLNNDQIIILKNLEHLGIHIGQIDTTSRTKMIGNFIRGTRLTSSGADNDSEYASSRYACTLKSILNDMTLDRLSVEVYPSILPLPPGKTGTASSVRNRTTSRWARNEARKKKVFTGGRQMVFIAGGMCFSELRAAHEIMAKCDKEIIMGSTSFITPLDFMQGLKSCK